MERRLHACRNAQDHLACSRLVRSANLVVDHDHVLALDPHGAFKQAAPSCFHLSKNKGKSFGLHPGENKELTEVQVKVHTSRTLLSSITVFMLSIQTASMSPSKTTHFMSWCGPNGGHSLLMFLMMMESTPSFHSFARVMYPYSSSEVTAYKKRVVSILRPSPFVLVFALCRVTAIGVMVVTPSIVRISPDRPATPNVSSHIHGTPWCYLRR